MNYRKMSWLLTRWGPLSLICLLAGVQARAQSTLSSSGATLESPNYTIEYAVGESVVETYAASAGQLTTGVLQPALTITAIDESVVALASILAYPNPFSTEVRLKADAEIERVQIVSMLGSEQFNSTTNNTQAIQTSNWKPGTYIGRVWTKGASAPTTFQLIKSH